MAEASKTPTHYVHFNGAAHFVKEAEFFQDQGGLTSEWGKAWKPVVALSIEDARKMSEEMHRGTR